MNLYAVGQNTSLMVSTMAPIDQIGTKRVQIG